MTLARAARLTSGRRLTATLLVALIAAGASLAYAQQIWVGGGFGRGGRMAPKWAKPADFNGTFLYCRGYYEQARYEDGGMGWWTDYPNADHNFSVRLAELTRVYVKDWNTQPNFVVVSLEDPLLYRCPMLFMEDVGTAEFGELEVKNLREFFLKGGFLWVDDFWGSLAWNQWARQMSRVLPPNEYPIFDIPLTHPIMHTLYDVKDFPQIPSINFWGNRSYHQTSERGRDSAEVHFRGIQDAQGRLMTLMTHNTDIADAWEREGESQQYFDLFSPRGYAIGVNVVLYAMTH
ncbi:MAG: hypothetical protein A3H97_01580 [Acidobacteria bacterium RIFCSPLOWO2_02_FULL_65_29]|nr:MAG: hypothetical protein A3H97_01580 [Acidobacteria bacterium RIFCSPLOWO2_02_FULL_65_29]